MDDVPRQILIDFVNAFGISVCDDRRRCERLLKDFCSGHRKEEAALVQALHSSVVTELLSSSQGFSGEPLFSRLTERLYHNAGLDKTLARWAVESWALALGIELPVIMQSQDIAAVLPPVLGSPMSVPGSLPEPVLASNPTSIPLPTPTQVPAPAIPQLAMPTSRDRSSALPLTLCSIAALTIVAGMLGVFRSTQDTTLHLNTSAGAGAVTSDDQSSAQRGPNSHIAIASRIGTTGSGQPDTSSGNRNLSSKGSGEDSRPHKTAHEPQPERLLSVRSREPGAPESSKPISFAIKPGAPPDVQGGSTNAIAPLSEPPKASKRMQDRRQSGATATAALDGQSPPTSGVAPASTIAESKVAALSQSSGDTDPGQRPPQPDPHFTPLPAGAAAPETQSSKTDQHHEGSKLGLSHAGKVNIRGLRVNDQVLLDRQTLEQAGVLLTRAGTSGQLTLPQGNYVISIYREGNSQAWTHPCFVMPGAQLLISVPERW